MKQPQIMDIVGQEIRRLQEEANSLDRQIDDLTAQRNRLRMLISVLEQHREAPTRRQEPRTLATQTPPEAKIRPPRPASGLDAAQPSLRVGLPARMREGAYAGLEGVIRWCKTSPRGMICTLSLRSPTGRVVRTQVSESSLGRKWELLEVHGKASPGTQEASPRKAPSRSRAGTKTRADGGTRKALARKSTGPRRATRPEVLLQRNTRVKVLKGKYAGWEGFISGIRDKKTAITYALTLSGPGGEEGRTQVNHGSLGLSWVLLDTPAGTQNEPATPPKVLRRRPARAEAPEAGGDPNTAEVSQAGEADPTALEAQVAEPTAGGDRPEDQAPAAGEESDQGQAGPVTRYTPSSPVLKEKTRIRMLSGPHLGLTGMIVRVQQHPGPKADAIYTILIEAGPDGDTVLTSARHSSLGRSWTVL